MPVKTIVRQPTVRILNYNIPGLLEPVINYVLDRFPEVISVYTLGSLEHEMKKAAENPRTQIGRIVITPFYHCLGEPKANTKRIYHRDGVIEEHGAFLGAAPTIGFHYDNGMFKRIKRDCELQESDNGHICYLITELHIYEPDNVRILTYNPNHEKSALPQAA